jgi:hypothetical protein
MDQAPPIERLRGALQLINARSHTPESVKSKEFSVFEAFQPGENALSRMLAYLLDPLEGHGQGRAFLNAFLSLLKMQPRDCPVWVRTEHPCERLRDPAEGMRRLDIVVRLDREHIGIESKPWAAEQDAQCGDYARELEAISRKD